MRRILIAPDKFKGTLTGLEAATAIQEGWRRVHPGDEVRILPISDGGDGFGAVLADRIGASTRRTPTVDAAGRGRDAEWWLAGARGIAVIETARVVGLALLPKGQFHPFDLDTTGLGAVVREVVRSGAGECWVGLGGSATNDGGFGLARALGWRFEDDAGVELVRWTALGRLARMIPPAEAPAASCRFVVAVDVDNPLLGPVGCSRVYGPQKGLRPEDMPLAEECLGRLARATTAVLGRDVASIPGSGAAGGLGFALQAFLDARVESGFDIFARASGLDEQIEWADLIVTGEGSLDRQSLMGKGTGRLAARARSRGKACIGLAGRVESLREGESSQFTATRGIVPGVAALEDAMADPARWLAELAARAAADLA